MNKVLRLLAVLYLTIITVSWIDVTPSGELLSEVQPTAGQLSVVKEYAVAEIASKPVRVKKNKKFYEGLLDDFLKKHFHRKWHGESYRPQSLRVENFHAYDTNTDEITGTFTFTGKLGLHTYDGREFRALVHDDGDGKYHVSFFRKVEYFFGRKQGSDMAIPNKAFIYKPE